MVDKPTGLAAKIPEPSLITGQDIGTVNLEQNHNGDLFREYQKQKQRLQETIQLKERERDELVRQLSVPINAQLVENRLQSEK